MRLLKTIFSRTMLIALAFLAQVAVMLVVAFGFNQWYWEVQAVSYVLAFFVLLHLFNKKENPAYKLPWLTVILIFPIFGILLYFLFAGHRIPRRQIRAQRAIQEACEPYLKSRHGEEVNALLGKYAGLEKYLNRQAYTAGHLGNRVTHYPSGEACFEGLLRDLAGAEHFIFMEFFIIGSGKMWDAIHAILREKAEAGVEVRILYDDIGSLGRAPVRFAEKMRAEGIACYKFNPVRPIVTNVYNNRDHRKLVIIDGKVGYTGGFNIADEYINETHPHGYWKDTAVRVEGTAVKNMTALFLQNYAAPTKRVGAIAPYLTVDCPRFADGGYVHPFGDGPNPFYPEQVAQDVYQHLIQTAEKRVWIMTPYLVPDYDLLCTLREAALRGVDVRIVVPHVPDKKYVFRLTQSHYASLVSAGVRIYEYTPGFIHAKQALFDDRMAFVGTVNLDYRSLVHHFEDGVLLFDCPCLAEIRADFEGTFATSAPVTEAQCQKRRARGVIDSLLQLFSPLL